MIFVMCKLSFGFKCGKKYVGKKPIFCELQYLMHVQLFVMTNYHLISDQRGLGSWCMDYMTTTGIERKFLICLVKRPKSSSLTTATVNWFLLKTSGKQPVFARNSRCSVSPVSKWAWMLGRLTTKWRRYLIN